MVIIKFLPYGKQDIGRNDIEDVVTILKSDFITQGPKIEEFEKKLAEYCGSKYAVTFNSGTSALHGAYFAFGLGNDDELITSPNTFVATSNAALYLNAYPMFSDVEKETGNLDVSKVKDRITDKTKLLVPVHYGGNPVDLKELSEIAEDNDVKIIEDAAHAISAKYNGEKIGNSRYSEMTIFSFHPVKHITTGEGGAVLTDNSDYYEKLLMFRSHGITKNNFHNQPHGDWYYEMHFLGYNYRMTDIQAALGLSQLKKLNKYVERRRKIAEIYKTAFENNSFFEIIHEKKCCSSSYHLFPILIKDEFKNKKREIFLKLREEGLGVQVHYIPVYLQPYYQKLGYKENLCPIAEEFYHKEISIPMYPTLNDEDIEYVISKIFKVFESF
ncbi:UDP-4-amino-4,6-dideoxy-N-acetyl-beta-L-altrosamine transaminase [Methanobacterium ferruginis]|uniref:UDP-4-amino-4, 6-dideoxy-N-acetyl-beta-L-altrosamine transaminase n=1 Tax=Methanobacterium ferruginis TaxID=710191 RepID=UPI00257349A2|nr:UDP-4-amino-4,6-dideoxy-N-acetyl-beta-L-altrosamine transaminase [Methanobacterium ferruginis]BDZ68986.1 UDP-4-amino-4,6-dideoxy-N-acetyl-beta-L-altrosami ne transaminase [Methanobacterium ferruginis]